MSFTLQSSDKEETVLVPGKTMTILLWVVKIIGLLFLIPGLLLLAATDMNSGEDVGVVFILTGTGLVFYLASVLGASYNKKLPGKLVFNNKLGRLLIYDKVSRGAKKITKESNQDASTYLSYSEIESFGIREVRTNKSISYAAYLKKRDGAVWDLLQSHLKKKTEEYLKSLQENVNIEEGKAEDFWGSEDVALEEIIEKQTDFHIKKDGPDRIIQWVRKSDRFSTILILIFIGGFNMVFLGARNEMTEMR